MKEKEIKQDKNGKRRVMGFQVIEDECIWMKAGVVSFRLCDNAYDCYNCPFDKAMRKTKNLASPPETKEDQPGWVQYLQKRYYGSSRPCRHALTGRIDAPKICTLNYQCYHCSYDQMLDEEDFYGITDGPSYRVVSGYRMADGYYYHMGHSWVRFEHGGRIRVGFDDFLVKLFGSMDELNLPRLGATVKQDQVGWTFGRESNKAAVLSPVTGTVLATNHNTQEDPSIANHDPYRAGWLFILEPELPRRNLKRLYFEKESFQWMEQETQKLMSLMGPENEHLVSTGGEAVNDIFANFPDLGWDNLVRTFLRTERV